MNKKLFASILLMASACGDNLPEPYISNVPISITASVYITPHPKLDRKAIADGCSVWREEGVACNFVDDATMAQVKVVPSYDECGSIFGRRVLATANSYGIISVKMKCMTNIFGDIEHYRMMTVFAHELGHTLGVWSHIPNDRKAIMNSEIPDGLDYMTFADHEYFLKRVRPVVKKIGSECEFEME